MNAAIRKLEAKLKAYASKEGAIEIKLQREYNKVFDADSKLQEAVTKLESSNDYVWNECGDLDRVIYVDLSRYAGVMKYLKEYMRDSHCTYVDPDGNGLLQTEGESIFINVDGRPHDRGVWYNHSLIVHPDEYTKDGEVNVRVRNHLIEKFMEARGEYAGVFETHESGSVEAVNTGGENAATEEEVNEFKEVWREIAERLEA